MEELIAQIINIEEQAQQIVAEAREEKQNLESDINKAAIKMQRDIEERVRRRCDKIKEFEDNQADDKIAAINSEVQKKINHLDEQFQKNADKWAEDIVNKIIC